MKKTICTQIYLIKGNKICLPLKKRGFGAGWHNGYGGKTEKGETILKSAKRELGEESLVESLNLEKRAVLTFKFIKTGEVVVSHVFVCKKFKGTPKETEEMKPYWFGFDKIPYRKMWPDDSFWMQAFLAGKKFKAEFEFLDKKPKVGRFFIKTPI
jgi:ADP-ribose pyrophosphatase YjhB (NUDIX family)